ncbi:type IV toxin-antitoxin system AbiEi family antitoxin domain-containing protein [Bacillus marasmi]|uniref:type IV toxin-antitoxin system AbiEi family antitoxin domain-containing protein n=1 Tax=Bacillus marasmi TaxID=1926279 RepID=UPI0011C969B3|nr:type IV toxin-antitoxin system AbiEi family antitoxin domain-containing protein [Bacillus marasmi]
MDKFSAVKKKFEKYGGILKTSELNQCGLTSRQINDLLAEGLITKIKRGFYELTDYMVREEVVIARLFPESVIFLESALMQYDYTDRIPQMWQIAVDKHTSKSKFNIDYPFIQPFYIKSEYVNIGIDYLVVDNVRVNIYNRDRTICDVLRYEKKLEKEVFNKAIQRYVQDDRKNIRKLYEYGKIMNIEKKIQTYIGVWL